MEFLRSAFPDARFVQVIRDGRAVVHSLLRVGFWKRSGGYESPFWDGDLPPAALEAWERSDRDAGVLAAVQWSHVAVSTRAEGAALEPGSYTEVRYEDFVANPAAVISELYAFCDLPPSTAASAFLSRGPELANMNHKYLQDFDADYVEALTRVMEPALTDLGYAPET